MTFSKQITSAILAVAAGSAVCATAALAQPAAGTAPAAPAGQLPPAKTPRENLLRLAKPITVDMKEWKLEDVIKFLYTETEAHFEVIWKTSNEDGLDPETLITFNSRGLDGLTVLEQVLQRATGDALTSDEKATWQMNSYGAIQLGPRKSLNKFKRTEIYDVSDLLFEVPVYDDVPVIDLSQVLRNSQGGGGGGGGGQSIFGNNGGAGGSGGAGNQQRSEERRRRRQELADELKRLLTSLAEKDQWEDNGGAGGTMVVYQGNIIVDAADYMHRAVAGYSWWPSTKQQVNRIRRYVSLSGNMEAAKILGLTPFSQQGQAGGAGTAP